MKRETKWVLAVAAVGLIAVPVVTIAWLSRPNPVYTDADTIRRPTAVEAPRDILWQPPRPLSEAINAPLDVYEPKISWDGLTMFFVRGKAGETADLYAARRTVQGWSEPRPLTSINSEHDELGPEPAADGASLYFYSDRPGGLGGYDLWVARRRAVAAADDPDGWQSPVNLGPAVNSEYNDYGPALARDGGMLFFASNRPGAGDGPPPDPHAWRATLREDLFRRTYDLYSCRVVDDAVQQAKPLAPLNTLQNEGAPCVSPHGDFLYFASDRAGGRGGFDLYRVRQIAERFAKPENLGPSVNSPANELDPGLAQLGYALYFSSDRAAPRAESASSQPTERALGASQPNSDEKQAPRYAVYYTTSREVYLDADARPIDWAGLWARLWPNLLWLLLGLLALLLLLLLYRDLRDRRLSLLARCLLASMALHCALLALLGAWRVSSAIGEFVREGGRVQITLAAAGIAESLSAQVRGTMTDLPEVATPPRDTPRMDVPTPPIDVRPQHLAAAAIAMSAEPVSSAAHRESRPPERARFETIEPTTIAHELQARIEPPPAQESPTHEPALPTLSASTTVQTRDHTPAGQPLTPARIDVSPAKSRAVDTTSLSSTESIRESDARESHLSERNRPIELNSAKRDFDTLPTPAAEEAESSKEPERSVQVAATGTATSRPAVQLIGASGLELVRLSPAIGSTEFQPLSGLSQAEPRDAPSPVAAASAPPISLTNAAPATLNVGVPNVVETDKADVDEPTSGFVDSTPSIAAAPTSARPESGVYFAKPPVENAAANLAPSASSATVGMAALAADAVTESFRPERQGNSSPEVGLALPAPASAKTLAVALPQEPDPDSTTAEGLPPAIGTLRGVVRDKLSGAPLAGANVRVDLAGSEPVIATTNDAGEYTLSLPQTPDFFAVTATADGYEPGARNMPGEALPREGLVGDFELEPETEMVIAVESEPEVHHLGNDAFEGAINSQFQRKSEGAALIGEFMLRSSQTSPWVERAEITLLAKGVQCPHQVIVNDRRLRARIDRSPGDGSFGELSLALDPRILKEGENTIEIRAVSCRGDLDDFEFVNVQIRLRRKIEYDPGE